MLLQSLWVPKSLCSCWFRGLCILDVLHPLWRTPHSFCLFFLGVSYLWGMEFDGDIPFRAERSKISLSAGWPWVIVSVFHLLQRKHLCRLLSNELWVHIMSLGVFFLKPSLSYFLSFFFFLKPSLSFLLACLLSLHRKSAISCWVCKCKWNTSYQNLLKLLNSIR